jgi:hypothetical protein
MAKFFLLGLVCLAACMQITLARDVLEALNNNIRDQLQGYEKFLVEETGPYKPDLQKLINIMETALKSEKLEEKQAILKNLQSNFSPEFNQYVSYKLENYQVNDDIRDAIEFYQALLNNEKFKSDVEQTIATLQSILKESDLKVKEDRFMNLNKGFSPEFSRFLHDNALPQVNRELQNISQFFENLLVDDNIKFATEIRQLKQQADEGLAANTVDEKQKILYEVTNPKNAELYEFLQTKFIEKN